MKLVEMTDDELFKVLIEHLKDATVEVEALEELRRRLDYFRRRVESLPKL